jgi:hypothetical protein
MHTGDRSAQRMRRRIPPMSASGYPWPRVPHLVSRPGEFHPQPLAERCGSLSTHTAPIKQTPPPSHGASE